MARQKLFTFSLESFVLNSILISIFLVLLSSPSHAQDPCFSKMPDSAWANGEPQNLDRQGVNSRYSLNGPSNFLFRFRNIPIQFRYEYLGKDCSLRTVVVDYLYSPSLEVLSVEAFIEGYKNSAKDLFTVEDRVSLLRNATNAFASSQVTLVTSNSEKGTLEWNTNSKRLVESLSKIIHSGFPESRFNAAVRPYFEIDSSCGKTLNSLDERVWAGSNRFEFFSPALFNATDETNPPIIVELSKAPCKANVGLIFGDSAKPAVTSSDQFQMLTRPITIVPMGEVSIIKKVTGKKITITCFKGKLTKKVAGPNPKCPSGYKKK